MSQKWAKFEFELVPQKVDFGQYLQTVAVNHVETKGGSVLYFSQDKHKLTYM